MRALTNMIAAPPSSSSSARERSNVRAPSSTQRARLASSRTRARDALRHNVGACGDSLRHLAVTADGYTLDNPYGNVALPSDIEGWRQLCRDLMARCREHFNALGEIEPAPHTVWNSKVDAFNSIVEKVNQLDDVGGAWTGAGVIEAISFCTGLASEQICFLEGVDKAIADLGGTAPEIPGGVKPAPPPMNPQELVGTIVKVAGVGIFAYVLVNLLQR